MKGYVRLGTPIRVGEYYRNGMSCCKVLEAMSLRGEVLVCIPKSGWTMLAHGAALYDTPNGEQLLWDYSTNGRFVDENKASTNTMIETFVDSSSDKPNPSPIMPEAMKHMIIENGIPATILVDNGYFYETLDDSRVPKKSRNI